VKRIAFWTVILGLVAATAYGLLQRPAERPLAVFAARAQKTTFVREVSADGYLKADRLRLAFPQAGIVREVRKRPGERVQKGEILALLEDTESRRRLALAEARLRAFKEEDRAQRAALRARLKRLQEKQAELKKQLTLTRALLAAGAASPKALEEAENNLAENARALAEARAEARRQAAQAEARRAELEAALAEAKEALEKTRLRAPADGTLESLPFRPGELARGEAVLVVAGSIRPFARFPEAEAGAIQPGQPARVELVSEPETSRATRVVRVLPPQREGDTAWVPVELAPLGEGAGAPDLSLTAYVEVERIEDAVVVPLESLVEDESGTYIWTIEKGRAHRIKVEKIAQNLTQAAVSGLAPGIPVVRLPPESLKEGTPLAPIYEEGDGGDH